MNRQQTDNFFQKVHEITSNQLEGEFLMYSDISGFSLFILNMCIGYVFGLWFFSNYELNEFSTALDRIQNQGHAVPSKSILSHLFTAQARRRTTAQEACALIDGFFKCIHEYPARVSEENFAHVAAKVLSVSSSSRFNTDNSLGEPSFMQRHV